MRGSISLQRLYSICARELPRKPVHRLVYIPAWAIDKNRYWKTNPISITIDEANLIIIDCIDQSIKIDTDTVLGLNCYRF